MGWGLLLIPTMALAGKKGDIIREVLKWAARSCLICH